MMFLLNLFFQFNKNFQPTNKLTDFLANLSAAIKHLGQGYFKHFDDKALF